MLALCVEHYIDNEASPFENGCAVLLISGIVSLETVYMFGHDIEMFGTKYFDFYRLFRQNVSFVAGDVGSIGEDQSSSQVVVNDAFDTQDLAPLKMLDLVS